MSDISVNLEGDINLQKAFDQLEKKTTGPIIRKSVRNGSKLIHGQARQNTSSMFRGAKTSVKTGKANTRIGNLRKLLRKHIILKAWARKFQKGGYGIGIGMRPDVPEFVSYSDGRRSYIPSAIEFGHASPGSAGGGKVTRPVPFMRNAFESKKNEAVKTIEKETWQGMSNAVSAMGIK